MADEAQAVDDLGRVIADTAVVVDVLAASPDAPIGCYAGWTVVELAGHVGQIHHWVTDIVTSRAAARPAAGFPPTPPVEVLPTWLQDGARTLVRALEVAPPDEPVWTISRHQRDMAFWRRRMVLETALHRWDVEDAAGHDPAVDTAVAVAGIEETLDVYLAQRLGGKDVGGAGERVVFRPEETDDAWTLELAADGVALSAGGEDADAVVRGTALDLWLLLTCRRSLDAVEVSGDAAAAALAARAATLSAGPAG